MKLSEIQAVLPIMFKSRVIPCVIGPHGIGKTEMILEKVKKMGYKSYMFNLGACDPGDILGVMVEDGKGGTQYYPPNWLLEARDYALNNPESGVVIYLDEINRMHRDTLNAVWPLFTENRLHQFILPGNVHCVAAMNLGDAYLTTSVEDEAFYSRFCLIKAEFSKPDWFTWVKKQAFMSNEMAKHYVNFLSEYETHVNEGNTDTVLPKQTRNARSHTAFLRLVYNGLPEAYAFEVCSGLVGPVVASEWVAYQASLDKPVTGEQIFNKPKEAFKKLREVFLIKDEVRVDAIKVTIDSIGEFFKSYPSDKPTAKHQDILEQFVNLPNLNQDLLYLLTQRLLIDNSDAGCYAYWNSQGLKENRAQLVRSIEEAEAKEASNG